MYVCASLYVYAQKKLEALLLKLTATSTSTTTTTATILLSLQFLVSLYAGHHKNNSVADKRHSTMTQTRQNRPRHDRTKEWMKQKRGREQTKKWIKRMRIKVRLRIAIGEWNRWEIPCTVLIKGFVETSLSEDYGLLQELTLSTNVNSLAGNVKGSISSND